MRRRIGGFTIVEVMIVVTVIGVLAAIAIPIYQDYSTRARVTEALGFMRPAQVAVSLFYETNFSLPSSNDEAEIGPPASMSSSVVESVAVLPNGAIEARLRHPSLSGHTLTMTPTPRGSLTWRCTSTLPDQFLPMICRAQP